MALFRTDAEEHTEFSQHYRHAVIVSLLIYVGLFLVEDGVNISPDLNKH